MPLNGVLNVYKEKGGTSFRVVSELRKITGIRSIGHTGTLDPDAEGVLVVCIGKATKLVGLLTDTDKTYRAVMLLGKRTDTQDISGNVLEECDMNSPDVFPDPDKIRNVFSSFTGKIGQIPPMYSALKVGGVKLVDAARRGEEIERKPREVNIYSFDNIAYNSEACEISFEVSCSKGTYIRTLCEDIGKSLGLPACLKSLVRTRAAGFCIADSLKISDIAALAQEGKLEEHIVPMDVMLASYDFLVVKDKALKKLKNGNLLAPEDLSGAEGSAYPGSSGMKECEGTFRIYDGNGSFYALYAYNKNTKTYKCEKMLI